MKKLFSKVAYSDENIEIYDLGENSFIAVSYSGPKTTAIVTSLDGVLAIGNAKCMPIDRYSKEIGRNIALGRAIAEIGNRLATLWSDRAVTLEEYERKHNNH